MSDQQAASLIARILRLHEEKLSITEDIKEVYSEAKSAGYDKTVLGAAVDRIRKRDAGKLTDVERVEAERDLYISAYDASHTHAHVRAA